MPGPMSPETVVICEAHTLNLEILNLNQTLNPEILNPTKP